MKWLSFNSIESNIYYKFVWAVMADIVATTSQVGTANPIPWRDNTIPQWIATIWCFYSGIFPYQQTWTSTTKHTYFKTSTNFRNMFKYSFYLFTLNNINIWDAIDLLEALAVQCWHISTSCFFCVLLINKTHKPDRGPSNEHFYQDWFQLAEWFQRKR